MQLPLSFRLPMVRDRSYKREGDQVDLVLVDGHGLFRDGLREVLEAADDSLRVVGEASDGAEAVAVVVSTAPDVVLIDLDMPGMPSVEAVRKLAAVAPLSRLLVLSGSAQEGEVVEVVLAGAQGYLPKDAAVDEIVAGVHTVARGESLLSPSVAAQLLEHIRSQAPASPEAAEQIAELTPREVEVLRLMAGGMENTEIAEALFISPRTAKNHVASILEKLHLQNRIQAAVFAVRQGIA